MVKRSVQKYPQTRQEYLAGNALDDCWSGRQITWSKDRFRNTPRPDRSTWLVTLLMTAGQAGKGHGQKIGSEIPRKPGRSTWLVTLLTGAGQVGRSHGQQMGSEIPPDQYTGVPGW
jgi:hypothetical protein